MKPEKELDILYDQIVTESAIQCKQCGSIENIMFVSDYEAAEEFRDRGWTASSYGYVYCPECSKKRAKKKKKK